MSRFDAVLDSIVAALPADRRAEVRAELGSHLDEAFAAARKAGLDDDAAARRAREQLGEPRALARRLRRSLWLSDLRELRGPALVGAAAGVLLQLGLPPLSHGHAASNIAAELAEAGWITLFVSLAVIAGLRRPGTSRVLLRLALVALAIEIVRIGLQAGVVVARGPEGWVNETLPVLMLTAATLQYGVFVAVLALARRAGLRPVGLRESLLVPLPWLACYALAGLPASLVGAMGHPVPQGALEWSVRSLLAATGALTAAVIAVRIAPDPSREWKAAAA